MKKKKTKSVVVRNINKPLLIMMFIYLIVGALMILSASSISSVLQYGLDSSFHFFKSQIIYAILGLIGFYVIVHVPTKTYDRFSKLFMAICVIAILFAFLNGKIFKEGINTVTLDLGFISFQPAELLKIIMIVYLGVFYDKWCNKTHKKNSFLIPLFICLIPISFIVLGGDFGSAAIMIALVALIFFAIPGEEVSFKVLKYIGIVFFILCILFLKFAYLVIPEDILESDSRLNRLIYKEPCTRYLSNSGYQVCNGYIAISNGNLFSLNIGGSTQKYLYLPESHTDFIFPIVVEELGVFLSIIILVGYVYMIFIILKVSRNSYKLQNSIICYGVAIYFCLHIFINLGGVLGLLPLTGVPLPFFSYGGSFIISLIGSFGIVQRIHIENLEEKKYREIRKITNS